MSEVLHRNSSPKLRAFMLVPGIALASAVVIAGIVLQPILARVVAVPSMILVLIIGCLLHKIARHPRYSSGVSFCIKVLLRYAVALLGLKISLGEIRVLGFETAAVVIISMIITVVFGIWISQILGQGREYGALAGVGVAVCGASATLATATVLPAYPQKDRDVVFVVIGVNTLSTAAMFLYPLICKLLHLDTFASGVLLGGTIHDVAQVVGAGYPMSDSIGNTAVIVKLFRVLLLLPFVLAVGLWISRSGALVRESKVPPPLFAVAFIILCGLNTVLTSMSSVAPFYAELRDLLIQLSNIGLLVAMAALGLSTSLTSFGTMGWRHAAILLGPTAVLFLTVFVAIALLPN
ncbi:YeiH family protein [Pseudolabrys sp.]|uniref:YeiH family protein n=1 Tax=Pseudolabrys sp. TaxID=1960880 RepID=UPI003D0BC844